MVSETGGRAFYNANALGDSIQRAVDDSRVTYALGFYPDDASWDGTQHTLEGRVNRPGVDVAATDTSRAMLILSRNRNGKRHSKPPPQLHSMARRLASRSTLYRTH